MPSKEDIKNIMKYTSLYFLIYLVMLFIPPLSRLLIFDYYISTGITYSIFALISILLYSFLAGIVTHYLYVKYRFFLDGNKTTAYFILNFLYSIVSYYLSFSTNSLNIPSYLEMNGIFYGLISIVLIGPIIPLMSIITINIINIVKDIKTSIYGTTGSLSGVLSLGCPSCGALIFSLLGLPFALAFLPFKGIELKIIAILSLFYALSHLSTTCLKNRSYNEAYRKSLYFVLINLLIISLIINYGLTQSILYDDPKKAMIPKNLGNIDVSQSTNTLMTISLVFPELKTATSQEEVIDIMLPKGTPEYTKIFDNSISFNKPVVSLNYLAKRYFSLKKEVKESNPKAWERYVKLASSPIGISCEFCCGVGPAGVDKNGNLRCGCQHNPALQTIALGLIAYTDMSDAEVIREVMKWKTIFFPRDMIGLGLRVSSGEISSETSLPGMVGGC